MAFDDTTNNTRPSTKGDSHSVSISNTDSSIYHRSIQQQTHENKSTLLETTRLQRHHWDQHELENARLLEADEGMNGMDGDLALLLNDLSMAKPTQPAHFMPYCA